MSSPSNSGGPDWSGADGEPMTDGDGSGAGRGRLSGYSHTRPMRVQWAHSGSVSWHLTFRRLQLRQPRRDLVWPFRGTGLRRTRTDSSAPDADADADADADSGLNPGSGESASGSTFPGSMMHLLAEAKGL
jgi:hypothetical protein